MKRLIDAYALQQWFLKNAEPYMKEPGGVLDFVLSGIKEQEPVICVSDDFPVCPYELSCRNIMCGGECCEEPSTPA